MADSKFIKIVKDYYINNGRDLPWRHVADDQFAYYVYISEMMLQQTQVNRVTEKFNVWIQQFPTIVSVADASLADIMAAWNGLGYNRRARYVYVAAKAIQQQYGGVLPNTITELSSLPGIGPNTAAAILVYAYNQPHVFIETNIRSVFMYHYFKNDDVVTDKDILKRVASTLDEKNPREWYWALMDYGSYLKRQGLGNNTKSKSYKKQTIFAGSIRQLRGKIIALLIIEPKTMSQLKDSTDSDERLDAVLAALTKEGLIIRTGRYYKIAQD